MSKNFASAQIEISVPFFDIDLMEIVWHGHYLKYFELARCAVLDKIDYDYMQMRESGYTWPVYDLHIRYAHPARFGQRLVISADIVEWKNYLKIKYQINDKQSGRRLTKGYTQQVAVSIEGNAMCYESPDILRQKLKLPKS